MRFKPNPMVTEEVEAQEVYQAMVKGRAEEAQREAEAIAPRGDTGHYAESFELVKTGKRWRLTNTDFAAHWVEWGSIHQAPLAVLRRAIRAAGLALRESPKP